MATKKDVRHQNRDEAETRAKGEGWESKHSSFLGIRLGYSLPAGPQTRPVRAGVLVWW